MKQNVVISGLSFNVMSRQTVHTTKRRSPPKKEERDLLPIGPTATGFLTISMIGALAWAAGKSDVNPKDSKGIGNPSPTPLVNTLGVTHPDPGFQDLIFPAATRPTAPQTPIQSASQPTDPLQAVRDGKVLKVGSCGEEVEALQRLLVSAGRWPKDKINGIYDEGLADVIRDIQSTWTDAPDGKVGPNTEKRLQNMLAQSSSGTGVAKKAESAPKEAPPQRQASADKKSPATQANTKGSVAVKASPEKAVAPQTDKDLAYKRCLKFMRRWEGGVSKSKVDRRNRDENGKWGAKVTNLGITWQIWEAWCEQKGLPQKPMEQLTHKDQEQIFKEWYWKASKADQLPPLVGIALGDRSFNMGVVGATRALQRAAGLPRTGKLSRSDIESIRQLDDYTLAEKYLKECQRVLLIIGQGPRQSENVKGWMNRIADLQSALEDYSGRPTALIATVAQREVGSEETPLKDAIAEFQQKHGLTVTGEIDDATAWLIDKMEQ